MALDFPNSPTNGQIFGAYTWNSARGVWLQTSMSSRVVTTSDTAPASPTNGDMWMYTVDGTCFIYYNDGTSGQWVEQSKSILTPATYQSPNYIINGAFDIWQRGASNTTVNGYIADRWLHSWGAGTATVSRSTDVPTTTLQYSLSVAGSSTVTPLIQQRIEAVNALPLVGQTVTFSIWAKSTVGTNGLEWYANFPVTADTWSSGQTSDQSGVFTATMTVGTWTRYSATWTVGSGAVRGYLVAVMRTSTASTTTLYAGAQLELGSVATPFRRNAPSIQAELAACQRYYQRPGGTNYTPIGLGISNTTTVSTIAVQFFVPFRVVPTLGTFSNLMITDRNAYDALISTVTQPTGQTSIFAATIFCTSTTVAQYRPAMLAVPLSLTGFIEFSAEL